VRLLITGGCGFIGSHFVNHAMRTHADWEVCVLDKLTYAGSLDRIDEDLRGSSRFSFLRGDILDRPLVERAVRGADVVVHYAAESHVSYSFVHADLFADVNVRGTSILCETVVHAAVQKLILVSSSEVYGNCVQAPMSEAHPLNPRSPYAGSKAAADRLAYSYQVAFGIPLVIVRPFNNYGPFQHTEKVVPRFITHALKNEPLHVHDDGMQTRDWLHVRDHARAMDAIVCADPKTVVGEVINIGTGQELTIRDIAAAVAREVGSSSEVRFNDYQRPGQVRRQVSTTDTVKRLVGWSATTSFEDGIRETVRWYAANEQWWSKLTSPANAVDQPRMSPRHVEVHGLAR